MAGSVINGILDERHARLLRLGLRFNPFSKTTPFSNRVAQTFVGRVDDLRRAAQALGDGSRNVLVLGGYGLGKTAFMLKLLAELQSSTRDFLTAYAPVTADLSEAVLRGLRSAVLALPDLTERVRAVASAEVGHTLDERRAQFVELLDLTTDVAPRVVIAVDEVDKRDAESVRSMLGGARPILDTRASFVVAARPLGLFRQMDAPVMAAFDRRIELSLLSDEEGRALVANYLRIAEDATARRAASAFSAAAVNAILRAAAGLPRLIVTMADAALESALDRLGHGGVGDTVEVVDLQAGLSSEGQRVLMPLTPQQLTVLGRVHALGEASMETLGEDLTEVESLVFQDVLVRIPDSNGEVIAVTPAANTELMARADRKRELAELWAETADAEGSHAKGASLQRFAEALFSESFKVLSEGPTRLDTAELDLVLEASQATDRRFRTGYVLVELKNWTAPVGSEVVSQLVGRLLSRNCKQGILVTRGRVTKDAELEAQNVAHDRQVIIVQGADIERYLREPSLRFSDLLTELHANLMLRPRRR